MTTITTLSAEEYGKLPDKHPGFKEELIEGELVWSPLPKAHHTVVIENLEAILKDLFPDDCVVRESGWNIKQPNGVESVPAPI